MVEYILVNTSIYCFPFHYTLLAHLKAADWQLLKETHFKQQQVYSFTPCFGFVRGSASDGLGLGSSPLVSGSRGSRACQLLDRLGESMVISMAKLLSNEFALEVAASGRLLAPSILRKPSQSMAHSALTGLSPWAPAS